MFACRWFELFVLVSSAAKTAHASAGQEVSQSRDLNQSEAEIILNAQTRLRQHLIGSLVDVGEKIVQFEGFHSVISEIIQDLQTRSLDPFKSFGYGSSSQDQSTVSLMAETIYNLQGGRHGPTTLPDWNFLLQAIPDFIPSRPNVQLTPGHLQRIREASEPFVVSVLNGIQRNYIKPNSRLLGDILYNYRFRDYSADLVMILDNFNQILARSEVSFLDFRIDSALTERPNEVLSDILKYILRKQSDRGLIYQIAQLLAALSDKANTLHLKNVSELWRLFDLMLYDDYPADVIQAKNALASGVRHNQIGLDLSGIGESMKGYLPLEKLLMLIAKLTSLPNRNPFSSAVHVVYPHIKLRYLSAKGKYFRPRTSSDIAFLLNSFLTVPDRVNPTIIREVHKIFTLSDFNEVLKDFDYSRYSRPRPLVMDMLHGLLNNPKKLPVCNVILLSYFLRKNQQVAGHTLLKPNDDILTGGSKNAPTQLSVFPDGREESPTVVPKIEMTTAVKTLFGSEPRLSATRPSVTTPRPSVSVVATTPPPVSTFPLSPFTSPQQKITWESPFSGVLHELYPSTPKLPSITPANTYSSSKIPPAMFPLIPNMSLQPMGSETPINSSQTDEPHRDLSVAHTPLPQPPFLTPNILPSSSVISSVVPSAYVNSDYSGPFITLEGVQQGFPTSAGNNAPTIANLPAATPFSDLPPTTNQITFASLSPQVIPTTQRALYFSTTPQSPDSSFLTHYATTKTGTSSITSTLQPSSSVGQQK